MSAKVSASGDAHQHARQKLDRRVEALLASLERWLPAEIAWERAMNAAAPLLLLETLPSDVRAEIPMQPIDAIVSALSNPSAMGEHVATLAQVQAAASAWGCACVAVGNGADIPSEP